MNAQNDARPAHAAPAAGAPSRSALYALIGVAAAYAVAQLLLFTLQRPLSWDEVVYLAQTAPGEPAMDWGPQRARGIAVLAAPVGLLHASAETVRLYFVVVSAVGLFLAFRPWLRVLGQVAAVGAAVFGFSWVGLYFGMDVFPNLPAALATVGTAGAVASFVWRDHRRSLLGIAAGIALVAFFRPPDSVWVSAPLMLGVMLMAWRRAASVAVAFFVGGVVGWAPWLIEMSVRYGSPLRALAAAQTESASGLPRNDLHQYLNLIEGPVRLIVTDPTLTYRALAALLFVTVLMIVGLLQRTTRPVAALCLLGGVGGVAPYLILRAGVNLRYLLPGWVLICIPVALGAAALWHLVTSRRSLLLRGAGTGLVAAVAVLWVLSNSVVAARNAEVTILNERGNYLVAQELADLAGDRPCAFVTEFGFPQMTWATDCIGLELDIFGETGQCPGATHDLRALSEQGYAIFGFARRDIPDGHPLSQWDVQRSRVRGYGPWRVYTMPPELAGTQAVPRIPRAGEASVPCPLSRAPTPDEIAPLRIGPRLPGDETIRFRERRRPPDEEAAFGGGEWARTAVSLAAPSPTGTSTE